MSFVGSSIKALLGVAVLTGGAGYAAVKGVLPQLPNGATQTLKVYTIAAAAQLGIRLEDAANTPNRSVGPPGGAPGAPGPGGPGGPRPGGPGGPGGAPPVSVSLGKAERKEVQVRFDAIGTVQPLASVVLRSRVDSQVIKVEVDDGAKVQAGAVLFRLDSRQIEAQIRQAEANAARNKAQLDLNKLDVRRKEALAQRESTSQVLLDTARANVAIMGAQIQADEAALENLRVIRSYYDVAAPIAGRMGVATLKMGAMARQGDAAPSFTIINQMSPIYVSFPVPQRLLGELREAAAAGVAKVTAIPQGLVKGAEGKVAVLDNAVDGATGTIMVRGTFENADELLWPGALVNVRLVLKTETNIVVVPKEALQSGQNGQFVFVVEDNVARVRPVVAGRTVDSITVIEKGLNGSETVVTDGHLRLVNGSRVIVPGARPPGAGGPPNAGAPPGGQPRPAGAPQAGATPPPNSAPPAAGAPTAGAEQRPGNPPSAPGAPAAPAPNRG